ILRPDHVPVSRLEEVITPMLTSGIGSVTTDERSNKLIVSDLPEVIERVEHLVRELDVPAAPVPANSAVMQNDEPLKEMLLRKLKERNVLKSGVGALPGEPQRIYAIGLDRENAKARLRNLAPDMTIEELDNGDLVLMPLSLLDEERVGRILSER